MTDHRLQLGNGPREPDFGDQTSPGTSADADRGSVRGSDRPHDRESEPGALAARAAIAVEPLEGFE